MLQSTLNVCSPSTVHSGITNYPAPGRPGEANSLWVLSDSGRCPPRGGDLCGRAGTPQEERLHAGLVAKALPLILLAQGLAPEAELPAAEQVASASRMLETEPDEQPPSTLAESGSNNNSCIPTGVTVAGPASRA